jgi:hypothetical protein
MTSEFMKHLWKNSEFLLSNNFIQRIVIFFYDVVETIYIQTRNMTRANIVRSRENPMKSVCTSHGLMFRYYHIQYKTVLRVTQHTTSMKKIAWSSSYEKNSRDIHRVMRRLLAGFYVDKKLEKFKFLSTIAIGLNVLWMWMFIHFFHPGTWWGEEWDEKICFLRRLLSAGLLCRRKIYKLSHFFLEKKHCILLNFFAVRLVDVVFIYRLSEARLFKLKLYIFWLCVWEDGGECVWKDGEANMKCSVQKCETFMNF